MAKLDKNDVPQIRPTGVDIGPSSQMPTSVVSGAEAVERGASQLAGGVDKLAAQFQTERTKANSFVSTSRELDFARKASEILYNAETGFLSTKGENAFDTASVHDKIEALRQEGAGQLPTEEARQEYDARTRVRAQAYSDTVERHAAAQRFATYDQTAKTLIATTKDEVAKIYTDPMKVDQLVLLAVPTLYKHFTENLGVKGADAERMIKAFQADMYETALAEYLSRKQYTAGLAYLGNVEPVLGEKAAPWRKQLGELSEKAQVEQLATQAWGVVQENAVNTVTGRFDPVLARDVFVNFYNPETRARIEDEIDREIATAVGAQNEQDVQRVARMKRYARAHGGALDKTAPDFWQLDDEGRDKVEADADLIKRLNEDKSNRRSMQAMFNRIGRNKFRRLPIEEQMAITEDEAYMLSDGIDEDGVQTILADAATLKKANDKGFLVNRGQFNTQVNNHKAILDARYTKKQVMEFSEIVNAWYDAESADDKPPTQTEINRFLGEQLTMYDYTFGDKPFFLMHEKDRKNPSIRKAALEEQTFEMAQRLLRGDFDTENGKQITPNSGEDWMRRIPGYKGKLEPGTVYDRVKGADGKSYLKPRR